MSNYDGLMVVENIAQTSGLILCPIPWDRERFARTISILFNQYEYDPTEIGVRVWIRVGAEWAITPSLDLQSLALQQPDVIVVDDPKEQHKLFIEVVEEKILFVLRNMGYSETTLYRRPRTATDVKHLL